MAPKIPRKMEKTYNKINMQEQGIFIFLIRNIFPLGESVSNAKKWMKSGHSILALKNYGSSTDSLIIEVDEDVDEVKVSDIQRCKDAIIDGFDLFAIKKGSVHKIKAGKMQL